MPEPGLHAEQTAVEMRKKILFFRSSKKKNTLKDKMMGDEVRREEKKKRPKITSHSRAESERLKQATLDSDQN